MAANTVTYLEMKDAAQLRPKQAADLRFRILEATVPQGPFNRFLYELVGREWAWVDRLTWSGEQWRSYVEGPELRTFVAYYDGSPAGYFELLHCDAEIEIIYLGLAPGFVGRGFGGPLLTRALEEAWAAGPTRVWLHTCTLDHPAALSNYRARGMRVYKTETE